MALRLRKSCLTFSISILLVGGAFRQTASAQAGSWSKLAGPYQGNITALVVDRQGYIYAATQFNGVYRSTDRGNTWTPANNGLTWANLTALTADSSGIVYGGGIFSGLFKTTDHGESWSRTRLPGGAVVARMLSGGRLCVGGLDTVSISTDQGQTWLSSRVADRNVQVISVAEDKAGNIYAGLQAILPRNIPPYGGGIYVSSDGGRTWQYCGQTLVSIMAIEVSRSGEMVFSSGYTVLSAPPKDTNWVQNAIGLPHSEINVLTTSSSGEVVAGVGGGLYTFNENTASWDVVLGSGLLSTSIACLSYDSLGTSFAGSSSNGIFRMNNSREGWVQCGIITAATTAVGFDKAGNFYVGTDNGIYVPGNEAGTWIRASDGFLGGRVYGFDTLSNYTGIYATTSSGLFYSRDAGNSWAIQTSRWTYGLVEDPSGSLYIGTTGGVLIAPHGSVNYWTTPQNVGFPIGTVYNILWSNGKIFAGTANNGVFVTTDGGTFWSQTGISSPFMFCSVKALAQATTRIVMDNRSIVFGGNIYAGTDTAGAFYTTDSGENWMHIPSITASDISCFLLLPRVEASGYQTVTKPMFTGTLDGGVFVSANSGMNWRTMNDGLSDSSVASLAIDPEGYLYAATDSGVYKSMQVVTGADSRPQVVPQNSSLSQNYPNPFNPTTAISYKLSAFSHVALKVYDVLGREVETLVNETQSAGTHTVTFDGSKLASGVYFYRIEAVPQSDIGRGTRSTIETKKMVLVK